MAQMLTCFSHLRFCKVGVGNRGGSEGLTVAKIVNTDNPHPQGIVCRSVSGSLLQPNNKSQEDGGTDHNCSLFATISRCSDRYHKWWDYRGERRVSAGAELSAVEKNKTHVCSPRRQFPVGR